jgi:hypothetical protein
LYEANYTFSRAQTWQMARQWFWHSRGLHMVAVVVLLCLSVVGLILWKTERVFAFLAGLALSLFVVHVKAFAAYRRVEWAELGEIVVRMTDEAVDQSTALGSSQFRWSAFRKVVLTADFVVLALRGQPGGVAIPRAALSAEAIAFAEQRVGDGHARGGDV